MKVPLWLYSPLEYWRTRRQLRLAEQIAKTEAAQALRSELHESLRGWARAQSEAARVVRESRELCARLNAPGPRVLAARAQTRKNNLKRWPWLRVKP
jgi:hypothetical protein